MLNKGFDAMAPTPSPDDAEQAFFFIRWWQEILSGAIVILTGWFLKAKGLSKDTVPVALPMSEEEIEHRLTISRQAVVMEISEVLRQRDKEFFKHVEDQNAKLLDHMRDLTK